MCVIWENMKMKIKENIKRSSVSAYFTCICLSLFRVTSVYWCMYFPLIQIFLGFSIFHSFNRHRLGIGSTLLYCWMLFFGSIILKRKCWKWEVHLHHHCDGWELWSRSFFAVAGCFVCWLCYDDEDEYIFAISSFQIMLLMWWGKKEFFG